MNTYVSLTVIALSSAAVLVLHLAAYEYHFYWTLWWYDIMMHGLGGFAIATLVTWLSHQVSKLRELPSRFFVVMAGVLFIGIMWELFELFIGSQANVPREMYVLDTMIDIGMDMLGGVIGYLSLKRLI